MLSGSSVCFLFVPNFEVDSKVTGLLKKNEGSHMSSSGP